MKLKLSKKSPKAKITAKSPEPKRTFWENVMQVKTLTRISYFLVFISSAFAIHARIVEFATFTICFAGLFAGYLKNEKVIDDSLNKTLRSIRFPISVAF